jgi:hypothetical protein
MKTVNLMILFIIIVLMNACEMNTNESYTVTFNFYDDAEGWTGDFADYPVDEEEFFELDFAWSHLPAPLETTKGALMLTGNNHSDDLFMFIKRKVDGLRTNTKYRVTVEVEFASNAPTNAAGIGGSPGEGVTMKTGAVVTEPDKIATDDFYSMNIDKGNQSGSGVDMMVIGHVGVSDTTTVYTLISRNNIAEPFEITSDENGEFWVVIGTDSGFEGITTLYYNRIKLVITQK